MEVKRRGHGRGVCRAADKGLREELRALTTRLEAVEAGRRRDPALGDDSGEETIVTAEESEEETQEVKLLRSAANPNRKFLTMMAICSQMFCWTG